MHLEGLVDSVLKIHPILTIPYHLHHRLTWITPLVFSRSLHLLLPPLSFTVARVIFSNIIYINHYLYRDLLIACPYLCQDLNLLSWLIDWFIWPLLAHQVSSPATHYLAHSTLTQTSLHTFPGTEYLPSCPFGLCTCYCLGLAHAPRALHGLLSHFSSLLKYHLFLIILIASSHSVRYLLACLLVFHVLSGKHELSKGLLSRDCSILFLCPQWLKQCLTPNRCFQRFIEWVSVPFYWNSCLTYWQMKYPFLMLNFPWALCGTWRCVSSCHSSFLISTFLYNQPPTSSVSHTLYSLNHQILLRLPSYVASQIYAFLSSSFST